MFNKVVSGIGTFSLVGSPLACASMSNVVQSQSFEDKLADLVGGVIKGEVDVDEDELYKKLVGVFPAEGLINFLEYFGKVVAPLPLALDAEAKNRLRRLFGAFHKLSLERFEGLGKNADVVAKVKSMYRFEKACMDAYVEGKVPVLSSYFKENLTEGDAENALGVVEVNGEHGDIKNVFLGLASVTANFERICSDDRIYESKPLCNGSVLDYMTEVQEKFLGRPDPSRVLRECLDKGELKKTGSTPAKPLDIIAPELDEEYTSWFKSKKVCDNKVEKVNNLRNR